MRTPTPIPDIDERGRQAARALQERLDATSPPPFERSAIGSEHLAPVVAVDERRRPRRVAVVAGAAAALLVALAIAAVVARSGEDGSVPAEQVGDSPRVAPTWVPDGLILSGASDAGGPSDPTTDDATEVQVFGPSPTDPRLGVAVLVPEEGVEVSPVEGASTIPAERVGGREVWDVGGLGPAATALMVELDGRQVLIVGPAATDGTEAAAEAVAATVTLAGDEAVVDPVALPGDWTALAPRRDVAELSGLVGELRSPNASTGTEPGSALAYQSDDGRALLTVRAFGGGEAAVAADRLVAEEARTVEVAGRDAVLVRRGASVGDPDADELSLTWSPSPGVVLRVRAIGLDEATVVRVAESLEPVDADAWEALEAEALRGGAETRGAIVLAEGAFADGARWVLTADPVDDEGRGGGGPAWAASVEVAGSGDGASTYSGAAEHSPPGPDGEPSSDPASPFPGAAGIEDDGVHRFAYGLLGDQVDRLSVLDADGATLARPAVHRPSAGGPAGWLWELGPGDAPAEVVAYGPGGEELGRLDLP